MAKRSPPSNVFEVDPDHFSLPGGFFSPKPGNVVVVLAEEGARAAGWSGPLTIDLAAAWGATGTSVILADGDVSDSPLQGILGGEGVEGMSDLVLFGASLERVARPAGGRPFRFASAGTVVADVEEAYLSPRWSAFFSAARDSGAAVILYLPAEAAGAARLSYEADRVLHLLVEAPSPEMMGDARTVVIHPPSGEAPSVSESGRGDASRFAAQEQDIRATEPSRAGPQPFQFPARAKSEPPAAGRRIVRSLILVLLVLILSLLVAAFLGYVSIPGITPAILLTG